MVPKVDFSSSILTTITISSGANPVHVSQTWVAKEFWSLSSQSQSFLNAIYYSSSRIGRKTVGPVSCRVGVGDVNFPRTRLLCGGCPPMGWDGWKRH